MVPPAWAGFTVFTTLPYWPSVWMGWGNVDLSLASVLYHSSGNQVSLQTLTSGLGFIAPLLLCFPPALR